MSPNKFFALFFLIVAMLGIVALWMAYRREKKWSWGLLKRNVFKLPKIRIGLAILSLVFVMVFSACYLWSADRRASAIITLNYSEAYKGQNANGTRYNMNEIICDEVVEKTIEKGAIKNVTVSELQRCLSVEPTVEGDAGSEDTYHISTEFRVTYKGKKNLNVSAEDIVRLLGYSYKEYYIEHYADNFDVLDITFDAENDFSDLDYLDVVENLKNKVSLIQNYMYGMAEKNNSFTSSEGETFYSIAQKCDNLYNVQLENNLRSYILDNGISKDAAEYVSRLEYNNTSIDYNYQKALIGFNVRRDAIDLYAEEMTRIVLVPTWDVEGEYYMGRTKVGIDQLSIEAEEYSQSAAEYTKEIQTNNSIIDVYNAAQRGTNETVNHLIDQICSEIVSLSEQAKKIGQEYSETRMNQCISLTVNGSSFVLYAFFAAVLFIGFYFVTDLVLRQMGKGDDAQ